MASGTWHLVYYDMEASRELFKPIKRKKIRLNATTEDEAIREAQQMWREIKERVMAAWSKRSNKSLADDNPKIAFDRGDYNPYIEYQTKF